MSASIDQNATEQPSKETYSSAATNGVLSPEFDYSQASTDVIIDGSPEYTLPLNGPVIDASYMAGYYTPTYVTYPTPAAVHSSTQEIFWSAAAAACDPASSYYATTGFMSPTGAVYDYSAHTAASSYGWLPDYSAGAATWSMASPPYAAGDGYYHTTSIEPYSNGELLECNTAAGGGRGDAQMNFLEQSVKAMGLDENGYCDGLVVDQKIPSSWTAVLPLTGHSGHHVGQVTGYRNKRTSLGFSHAVIDSTSVWATGSAGGYRNQQLVSYRGMATTTTGGLALKKSSLLVEKLQAEHQYNPKEFDLNLTNARYFVIKSYSEDDIHRSIKYGIWCSTDYGNKRLDAAFRELEGKAPLFLLYSVNGSGHFCGVAEMTSPVDYLKSAAFWAQDKWKGQFTVRWIYVKDVPNSQLRHIRLENNEGKPVTNSRDTQEVPPDKGKLVLNIIHNYQHTTSIFDDFLHYEQRQEEYLNTDTAVAAPATAATCVTATVSSIVSDGSQKS